MQTWRVYPTFNQISFQRDKKTQNFPKGISQKVNVIARLEIELVYFEAAVQDFGHNTTRIPIGLQSYLIRIHCKLSFGQSHVRFCGIA